MSWTAPCGLWKRGGEAAFDGQQQLVAQMLAQYDEWKRAKTARRATTEECLGMFHTQFSKQYCEAAGETLESMKEKLTLEVTEADMRLHTRGCTSS